MVKFLNHHFFVKLKTSKIHKNFGGFIEDFLRFYL